MKIYCLKRCQFLPISQEEAWDFFSSPRNLSKITPGYMEFEIKSISGREQMYAGQMIHYKLNVLPGIPTRWVTEITHVRELEYFVDEQRIGPYALWNHQHFFKAVEGGVEMRDEVHYALPLGALGQVAHWLFVQREINAIFNYRFEMLESLFSKHNRLSKTA
ncbi:SRPBCC family protein [Rapidithrix thailandica]|uniref:SRPBCC family protein n=1 Tax=Rapidithrix thailandica TaxID=413964 RepID=A0AAW9S167_9BACT